MKKRKINIFACAFMMVFGLTAVSCDLGKTPFDSFVPQTSEEGHSEDIFTSEKVPSEDHSTIIPSIPDSSLDDSSFEPTYPSTSEPSISLPDSSDIPTYPEVSLPDSSDIPTYPDISLPDSSMEPSYPETSEPEISLPDSSDISTYPEISLPDSSDIPTYPDISLPESSDIPTYPNISLPDSSEPEQSLPDSSIEPSIPETSIPESSEQVEPTAPTFKFYKITQIEGIETLPNNQIVEIKPGAIICATLRFYNPDQLDIKSIYISGVEYKYQMFGHTVNDDVEFNIQIVASKDKGTYKQILEKIVYTANGETLEEDFTSDNLFVEYTVRYNSWAIPFVYYRDIQVNGFNVKLDFDVYDYDNLIVDSKMKVVIRKDDNVVFEQQLRAGTNLVDVHLDPNTYYTYTVEATYDALDGRGLANNVIYENNFTTSEIFKFGTINPSKESVDFELIDLSDYGTISKIVVSDGTEEFVFTDPNLRLIKNLKSNRDYILTVYYTYDGKEFKNTCGFHTKAKTAPVIGFDRTNAVLNPTEGLEYKKVGNEYHIVSPGTVSNLDTVVLGGYKDGLPITTIDFHAFLESKGIKKVIILDTIDVIEDEAFLFSDIDTLYFESRTTPIFKYRILTESQKYTICVPDESIDDYKNYQEEWWSKYYSKYVVGYKSKDIDYYKFFYNNKYNFDIKSNSIKFNLDIIDPDNILNIVRIEALSAGEGTVTLEDPSLREINHLIQDKLYTLIVTFNYDLNEGNKVFEGFVSCNFKTLYPDIPPELFYDNIVSSSYGVEFSLKTPNACVPYLYDKFEIYEGDVLIDTKYDQNTNSFENLKPSTTYTLKTYYTYYFEGVNEYRSDVAIQSFTTEPGVELPTMRIVIERVTYNSVIYRIEKTQDQIPATFVGIEVYEGTYLSQRITNENSVAINHLRDQCKHTLKLIYSYVSNETGEVVQVTDTVDFETPRNITPYLNIRIDNLTTKSFDYNLSWNETRTIGTITSIRLINGENIVSLGTNLTGTVSNLTKETEYNLEINYTYDLNDGAGIQANTINKLVITKGYYVLNTRFTFINAESAKYEYTLPTPGASIKEIKLLNMDGTLNEAAIIDQNTCEITNLQAATTYKFVVTVLYYDENNQQQEENKEYELITRNYSIPHFYTGRVIYGATSFNTDASLNGYDNNYEVVRTVLKQNDVVLQTVEGQFVTEFKGLTPMTPYAVEYVYRYDLHDGLGFVEKTDTVNVSTRDYIVPEVTIYVYKKLDCTEIDLNTNDIDELSKITAISIYQGETLISTQEYTGRLNLTTLTPGTEYKVVVNYTYQIPGQDLVETSVEKLFTPIQKIDESTPNAVKYDFTNFPHTSSNGMVTLADLKGQFVFGDINLIDSLTECFKIYPYKECLKFGTGIANGKLTFTTSKNIKSMIVEYNGWKTRNVVNTLTINGITKEAVDDVDIIEDFNFETPTNTITMESNIRIRVKSIIFIYE